MRRQRGPINFDRRNFMKMAAGTGISCSFAGLFPGAPKNYVVAAEMDPHRKDKRKGGHLRPYPRQIEITELTRRFAQGAVADYYRRVGPLTCGGRFHRNVQTEVLDQQDLRQGV